MDRTIVFKIMAKYQVIKDNKVLKEFDKPSLNFLVDVTLETTVKTDVAQFLSAGIKLPRFFEFKTINEEVIFEEGLIIAGCDFCRINNCVQTPPVLEGNSKNRNTESKGRSRNRWRHNANPDENYYDYEF